MNLPRRSRLPLYCRKRLYSPKCLGQLLESRHPRHAISLLPLAQCQVRPPASRATKPATSRQRRSRRYGAGLSRAATPSEPQSLLAAPSVPLGGIRTANRKRFPYRESPEVARFPRLQVRPFKAFLAASFAFSVLWFASSTCFRALSVVSLVLLMPK
jgi:hypothetical protein